MADKIFCNGLTAKRHYFENGGEIIKVGVKVDEFIEWLKANKELNQEWLNLDLCDKKDGSGMYGQLNTYKKV